MSAPYSSMAPFAFDDNNMKLFTLCFVVGNEERHKAVKRVSQLSQSDLESENDDGDSYVVVSFGRCGGILSRSP